MRGFGQPSVELSEIALGTWGLSGDGYGPLPGGDPDIVLRTMVARALSLGITTFDLAPLWGNGATERVVGAVVKEHRERAQLITRAGVAWKDGQVVSRYEPYDLIRDCESSLRRLQADAIDVWLLHNPSLDVISRDDWVSVASRLKEDGKIRAFGVSVSDADAALSAVDQGAEIVCVPYNLLFTDLLHEIQATLEERGTGVLVRSALSYGLLGSDWQAGHQFSEGDHRRHRWDESTLRRRIKQVDGVREAMKGDDASLAAAAIRFVLNHPQVTSVAVGARTSTQLEEAASCAGAQPYLSETLLRDLPAAVAAGE